MKTELKSKKYYIIDLVIIFLVTGLTIFYLLKNGIFSQLGNLSNFSWKGIITICLVMLSIFLLEITIIFRTSKMSNIGLSYKQATGLYFFGSLGSNITPIKAGHFPFMIYYLTKNRFQFEKSLSLLCLNQIIYSTTTIVAYFSLFLFTAIQNTYIIVMDITIHLKFVALVGLLFNVLTISLVIAMTYSKKFHSLIINICAWFLLKLKKIESKEDYANQQREKMLIYKNQINYFIKHFYKFLPSILMYAAFLFLICGLPYFIYVFLTNSTFNFADYLFFFSLNQTMSYITNVIPVPGGTGVAEFSFLTIFAVVYPESLVGTGMIVWRFFSYYLPIVISFFIFLFFMIKNRKYKQNLSTVDKQPLQTNKIKT